MKKKSNHIFIFLLLASVTGACKKDLNNSPVNTYTDGNLIKDQQTAQAVLVGVYYRFADAGLDYTGLVSRWSRVNEFIPSELAGSINISYNNGRDDSLGSFTFSPGFGDIDSVWTYGYNLVNAANGFISNATPANILPASTKRQMLAEARFLRAFGNSELLFNFGQYRDPSSKYGIILRDTFVIAANVNLPRTSVAAAYTSILADLDLAIAGLPELNSAIYYANASTAKLLKARILMNRGTAGDYAQVIALTKDLIANSPFTLEDSLKEIFLNKGLKSGEVMLGIQPYPDQTYKGNLDGFAVTDGFAEGLAGDARSQWMIFYNTLWYPLPFYQSEKYYAGDDPAYPESTPLSECSYPFRLTEAYLLEAEAITLSTGDLPTARALLKTVLSHAGAGPQQMAAIDNATTPEALQLEIVKENLRNFVNENGVDWLALRRLPFATIQQLNPNIKAPHQLILPIPTAELIYNNVMQNPGY
jgi:hypothetical protein